MQVDDKLICKLLAEHDDPRGMEDCSVIIIDLWFCGRIPLWEISRLQKI